MGVETKFKRFGVETRLNRFGVETNPLIEEIYPAEPRPVVVDSKRVSRNEVLTILSKLGDETKFRRLGLDTKFKRFGVETKLSRLGVETKFNKLGVETKFNKLGLEINGKIEEANSLGSTKLLIYRSNPAVVETRED